MAWYPGPGWQPWDALEAAGVRVTSDPRNVSPPCALATITSAQITHACPVEYTVQMTLIAAGPEHGDGFQWLWTVAAPPLFPYTDSVEYDVWNDYPAITADLPATG